jgi:transcriptional regulator with XRE-family HTH domain
LDISRSTLAQIEIQYRYLSDDELLILAAVLNLSTDDLYPEEIKRRYRNKRHTRLK